MYGASVTTLSSPSGPNQFGTAHARDNTYQTTELHRQQNTNLIDDC
jgi:hypothetical protein